MFNFFGPSKKQLRESLALLSEMLESSDRERGKMRIEILSLRSQNADLINEVAYLKSQLGDAKKDIDDDHARLRETDVRNYVDNRRDTERVARDTIRRAQPKYSPTVGGVTQQIQQPVEIQHYGNNDSLNLLNTIILADALTPDPVTNSGSSSHDTYQSSGADCGSSYDSGSSDGGGSCGCD